MKRSVTTPSSAPLRPTTFQNGTACCPRSADPHSEQTAQEPRYPSLLQNSSDMMFLLDAGGTIGFAGPSCTRILGYTPEELVGHSCFALIHPGDLAATARELAALIDVPAEVRKAEFRLLARDGMWHWFEGVGTNLLADPGVHSIVVNSRDITERKQAEIGRQVFFEVIHALNVTPNLDELLVRIHSSLKKVVYAENCFVALYEPETEMFHFRFFVDQLDAMPPPQP